MMHAYYQVDFSQNESSVNVRYLFTSWLSVRPILAVCADKAARPADSRSWWQIACDEPWSKLDAPDMAAPDNRIRSSGARRGTYGRRHHASRVGPRATDTVAQDSHNGPRHRDARRPVHVSTPVPFNDRRATDNWPPHTTRAVRARVVVVVVAVSILSAWPRLRSARRGMNSIPFDVCAVHTIASLAVTQATSFLWRERARKSGHLPGVKSCNRWIIGDIAPIYGAPLYTDICGSRCSNWKTFVFHFEEWKN